MSKIKIISLIHNNSPVQLLTFNRIKRKEEIIETWKHLYGKAFSKATIKID